ncbi:MAG: hypothetical protein AAFS10_11230 [Myxococcota bacterium]
MTTLFRLNLPGFTIELKGERTYVEDLYRSICRDLEPMMTAAARGKPIRLPELPEPVAESPESRSEPTRRRSRYIWVYLCTSLFNKVYVVENPTIEYTAIGRFIDVDRIRRIYLDRVTDGGIFHSFTHNNKTLWAEFTHEGRALLRETVARHHKGGSDDSTTKERSGDDNTLEDDLFADHQA